MQENSSQSKNVSPWRKRYDERKAKGLCQYCPNKAEKGHVRCSGCKQITSDYSAGRRDIWKLKGLCSKCGKHPSDQGYVTCEGCREKSRLKNQNLRNQ